MRPGNYRLTYEVRGSKGTISYLIADDGSTTFTLVDPNGGTKTETYSAKRRGPGGNDRRPPPPPPRDDRRTPQGNDARSKDNTAQATPAKPRSDLPQLAVTSTALDSNGNISAEFTCDGAGASPPVEWTGAPEGTKCFALSLWHTAPDQEKSYWVIYDIPADRTTLAMNVKDVGKMGLNDKRRAVYEPMCSKGPGVKTYHITIYALSAEPKMTPEKATRANLLTAIKDMTLAEGTLDFQYERKR